MKGAAKKNLKKSVKKLTLFLRKNKIGRNFLNIVYEDVMNMTRVAQYQGCNLTFTVPNNLNHFRVDTFNTKEPETLEWINSIPIESVLWDIGANVGLYTCYAAKARSCQVIAFEPSVFNLELLARNIYLNELVDKVTIFPLPLSENLNINTLNMTTTKWGGALSTFGQDYGDDGNNIEKEFVFSTVGVSMLDAVDLLKVPKPDYIKMDVDGIEHLILKGGAGVLKFIKGILIEVNEDFEIQASNVPKYLTEAGLILKERRHSDLVDKSNRFNNTYNQIWYRPSVK